MKTKPIRIESKPIKIKITNKNENKTI